MPPVQFVVEDNREQTLESFADTAVKFLTGNSQYDEVVRLADSITELKNDHMTRPENIYELPDGFQYNFSGFSGQVIGVGRVGIRELHKLMERR